MNLDQQCELYETLGRLVTQRAELYSGILCLRLQRAQQTLDDHKLLGSVYSVRSLNDGSWQQQLPSAPRTARPHRRDDLFLFFLIIDAHSCRTNDETSIYVPKNIYKYRKMSERILCHQH